MKRLVQITINYGPFSKSNINLTFIRLYSSNNSNSSDDTNLEDELEQRHFDREHIRRVTLN